MLFLLLPLLAAAAPPCNVTSAGGYSLYHCRAGQALYRVKASVNEYARITCEEGPLPCPGLPPLPLSTHSLHVLHVQSCTLSGTLACVARALGAAGARRLRLQDAQEQLSGDMLGGLEGVESLDLDHAAAQTTLPLDLFANMSTLTNVIISGANITLDSRFQPPNHHLKSLELREAGITSLPIGAFSSLPNLTRLSLSANEIRAIEPGAFEGLSSLLSLDLSQNPLSDVADFAFRGAPRLRNLTLVLTPLRELRNHALRDLQELEMLHIYLNRAPLALHPSSLSHMRSLRRVLLVRTPLTSLPEQLRRSTQLTSPPVQESKQLTSPPVQESKQLSSLPVQESKQLLSLPEQLLQESRALEEFSVVECGVEEIPELLFHDNENLQFLDLSKNKLRALPEQLFWSLRKLRDLDLSGNQLLQLPERIFSGLGKLHTLKLDGNRLQTLADTTFHGLWGLQHLSISRNQLTLDKESPTDELTISPFMPLKLLHLNLSDNRISAICDDWRQTWVHGVQSIDLAGNRISKLEAKDLQFTTNVTIDLRRNQISSIDIGQNLNLYPRPTFLLDDNPFHCDCTLYPLLDYISNHQHPKIIIEEASCAYPAEFHKKLLKNVTVDSLICTLIDNVCPEDCICLKRPAKEMYELECSNLPPLDLYPNPMIYNLTKSKLKLSRYANNIELPTHVFSLNLSNLNLFEVPTFPNTVSELDLRFNNLETVPNWVLDRNVSLYLPNRSLKCDCDNQNDVRKMDENKFKIKDFDDLLCQDGRHLAKIDVGSLCNVFYASIIGGTLATVGLLALIAAVLIYRFSKDIKIFIYIMAWDPFFHKVGLHVIYEEDIDQKEYDVLISYSDEQERYIVQNFVPVLEDEGYTVSVRYRDWDIGDWIPGKAAQLVEKSRRTIVLLSQDYLNSVAALELQAALMSERRDRRRRVLIVATKDLEPDPNLKEFLDRSKSFVLEDEAFWSRLRRKLPRKREGRRKRLTQKTLNVLMTAEGRIMYSSKKSIEQC